MIRASSPGTWGPSVYWLLSSRGRTHEIFLIMDGGEPGCGKALPVFSAERSAVAFLESSTLDPGIWHARGMDSGELISVLYGPCGRISGIALDPVEGPVVSGAGLRTDVGRGAFLDMLSGRSLRSREIGGPYLAPGPRGGTRIGV